MTKVLNELAPKTAGHSGSSKTFPLRSLECKDEFDEGGEDDDDDDEDEDDDDEDEDDEDEDEDDDDEEDDDDDEEDDDDDEDDNEVDDDEDDNEVDDDDEEEENEEEDDDEVDDDDEERENEEEKVDGPLLTKDDVQEMSILDLNGYDEDELRWMCIELFGMSENKILKVKSKKVLINLIKPQEKESSTDINQGKKRKENLTNQNETKTKRGRVSSTSALFYISYLECPCCI
jgi:hypothetical protein